MKNLEIKSTLALVLNKEIRILSAYSNFILYSVGVLLLFPVLFFLIFFCDLRYASILILILLFLTHRSIPKLKTLNCIKITFFDLILLVFLILICLLIEPGGIINNRSIATENISSIKSMVDDGLLSRDGFFIYNRLWYCIAASIGYITNYTFARIIQIFINAYSIWSIYLLFFHNKRKNNLIILLVLMIALSVPSVIPGMMINSWNADAGLVWYQENLQNWSGIPLSQNLIWSIFYQPNVFFPTFILITFAFYSKYSIIKIICLTICAFYSPYSAIGLLTSITFLNDKIDKKAFLINIMFFIIGMFVITDITIKNETYIDIYSLQFLTTIIIELSPFLLLFLIKSFYKVNVLGLLLFYGSCIFIQNISAYNFYAEMIMPMFICLPYLLYAKFIDLNPEKVYILTLTIFLTFSSLSSFSIVFDLVRNTTLCKNKLPCDESAIETYTSSENSENKNMNNRFLKFILDERNE